MSNAKIDHGYHRLCRHLTDPIFAADYISKHLTHVEEFATESAHEALELAVDALCKAWRLREYKEE